MLKLISILLKNLNIILSGLTDECSMEDEDCTYTNVCPKVTEITECSEGGIYGYTTYELSLITSDEYKNIYAIYGNNEYGMIVPAAYQNTNILASNIGGINEQLLIINPTLRYDSWLTIGLTNGDPDHLLSSVGIDFNTWNSDKALITDNGAIFAMNPGNKLSENNEYIIGQITIPSTETATVTLNVQGKNDYRDPTSERWTELHVNFNLTPPKKNNNIPQDCEIWYDGCNTCLIVNNNPSTCTDMECIDIDKPNCLRFINNNGH